MNKEKIKEYASKLIAAIKSNNAEDLNSLIKEISNFSTDDLSFLLNFLLESNAPPQLIEKIQNIINDKSKPNKKSVHKPSRELPQTSDAVSLDDEEEELTDP